MMHNMQDPHEFARSEWKQYNPGTYRGREQRKRFDARFKEMFPLGHDTDMKPDLEMLQAAKAAGIPFWGANIGMESMHPDAYALVLQHGINMRPIDVLPFNFQTEEKQPLDRRCFHNAVEFMYDVPCSGEGFETTYVEGVSFSPTTGIMHHAWNGFFESDKCVDWTLYGSTQWTRYFGVRFTSEEHRELVTARNPDEPMRQLLFKDQNFPFYKNRIEDILKRRQ